MFVGVVCLKNIILVNLYRPPPDVNENYKSFIEELKPVISKIEKIEILMLSLLGTQI